MKFKISKAEWDSLSDEQKALYTAKGDSYQMKIEGLPDVDAMEVKLNKLLDEAKQAKSAKTEAEQKAAADAEAAARAKGDIEALDKSWGDKLAAANQATEALKQKYHGQIGKLLVENKAAELGTKLFGKNAALLQHHITARLTLEEGENGEFKTRVLGADGKPSAHTLDDLAKEFTTREDFKTFLVTTKATGPTGALNTARTDFTERKNGVEGQAERRARALEIAQSVGDSSDQS